ncbi:MAG TPA: alpha-1,4-glucan--maltose-1-phosphate maltosyltransferase, partial [Saprospiraceae bacterium]|nr:alpha-1,4-glucan--maltose-1-phosphate maltosyltransferase [Saprospiraceae bacterium]
PGSPWAIGSDEGGHKAVHSELGTIEDYKRLIINASKHGIDIALDLAFQCAPDHPWIKEHPAWFLWRPDGTIAYAENPPKKYQDIVPINFESDDWQNLWEELKSVLLYWCEMGVTIFRVDNPHTKPFRFWEWALAEVHKQYPDTIFLSEAFTRPKIMAELAKLGFTQSYTYYTWRNSRRELEEYLTELTQTELREYFRPNFWPNTPDILAYEMMGADSNTFALRYVMAATLSSNYGLYGPAYEFLENTGNNNGKEEYFNSEKYEIRTYDWNARNRITDLYKAVNRIRREHKALQTTWNIHFTRTDNEQLMSYVKRTDDGSDVIWCVVNFDTQFTQSGFVEVPKKLLGIEGRVHLLVTDLLTGETYHWFNDWNYVELNPAKCPIHIFNIQKM